MKYHYFVYCSLFSYSRPQLVGHTCTRVCRRISAPIIYSFVFSLFVLMLLLGKLPVERRFIWTSIVWIYMCTLVLVTVLLISELGLRGSIYHCVTRNYMPYLCHLFGIKILAFPNLVSLECMGVKLFPANFQQEVRTRHSDFETRCNNAQSFLLKLVILLWERSEISHTCVSRTDVGIVTIT